MRVTTTKPRRCGSISGYPMHCGTVTLHDATAEQIATANAAVEAAEGVAVSRDPHNPARWTVRQKPSERANGGYVRWGGADHDHVEGVTCEVANVVRRAVGLPEVED